MTKHVHMSFPTITPHLVYSEIIFFKLKVNCVSGRGNAVLGKKREIGPETLFSLLSKFYN